MANITLKRYDGGWDTLNPQTTWNQITSKPSTFTPTSHTHTSSDITDLDISALKDNTHTKHDASDLAVGWYTIATNTGNRAIARFGLRDTDSSRHQSVIFYAAHHYGNDDSNTITVLHNSRFGTSPFRYIRIKEGGTYDGAALQIYIDDAQNNVRALMLGDNFQSSGWVLKDWIADAIDPGDVDNWSSMTEKGKIDLDQIDQGGIATTGNIYAAGNITQGRVLTTLDSVNADTLDSINSTQFLRSDQSDTMTGSLTLSSASYIEMRVNQTDSGYIRAGVSSGTAEGFIDSTGNGSYAGQGKIKFLTEGSEKVRIDTNGNVGIGTTSPLSTLNVHGDSGLYITTATNAPTDGAQIRFSDHSSQSQYGFIKYKHANQTVETEPVNSDDGFIIGGSEANTVVSIQGSLNVEGQTNFENQVELDAGDLIVRSGTISANSYRSVLRDNSLENQATNGNADIGINYYGYAGGTTQFRDLNIYDGKTNLIATFDGSTNRVGIGTSNPDEKLHIEGNILVDAYNNSPGDSGIFFREGYTASQPSGATQPYNVSITLYDGSNAGASYDGLAINGFDGVAIRTNNASSPKLLVRKDGYVGIGATNPGEKLDVEGAGIFNSNASSRVLYLRGNGNIVQFQGSSNQNVWEVVGREANFYIYNNDLSKYSMYIDDGTNNIGINGQGSPSYALDVIGDVNVTGNFKVNGTNLSTGGGTLSYAQLGSVTVPYSTSTTSMSISPSNGLNSIIAIEVQVFSNASPATWTGPLNALSANSTYKAGIWGGSTQYANFYRNSAGTSITFSGAPSANIYNATVYEIKVV